MAKQRAVKLPAWNLSNHNIPKQQSNLSSTQTFTYSSLRYLLYLIHKFLSISEISAISTSHPIIFLFTHFHGTLFSTWQQIISWSSYTISFRLHARVCKFPFHSPRALRSKCVRTYFAFLLPVARTMFKLTLSPQAKTSLSFSLLLFASIFSFSRFSLPFSSLPWRIVEGTSLIRGILASEWNLMTCIESRLPVNLFER